MKITLIHAGDRSNTMPPLGILYIASALLQAGHKVQTFDPAPKDNSFIDKINKFEPDIVGLSLGITSIARGQEIIGLLKALLKNTLYCAGGIYPTTAPEDCLRRLGLDFVVVGEGEEAIVDICKQIENDLPFKPLKKIYRYDLIKNLDELPMPKRELLNFGSYLIPPGLIRGTYLERTTTILTSRGCPYTCIFCSSHLIFGKRFRRRSVDNVIAEIKYLIETYKIQGIWFVDDEFTLDRDWIMDLCLAILLEDIKFSWGCQSRVDTIDKNLLVYMKLAGCVQVDFGVESGSLKVLRTLKKKITPEQIINALKLTKQVGLRTFVTVMIGNPDETFTDIEQTKGLLRITKPDFVGVGFITPYPGSELYDMAIKNNWFKDKNIFYSKEWLDNESTYPVMTISFTREQLIKIKADIQNEFCGPGHYKEIIKHPIFIIKLGLMLLKHPVELAKGLKIFLKSRNFNDIAELAAIEYRQENAKKT